MASLGRPGRSYARDDTYEVVLLMTNNPLGHYSLGNFRKQKNNKHEHYGACGELITKYFVIGEVNQQQ